MAVPLTVAVAFYPGNHRICLLRPFFKLYLKYGKAYRYNDKTLPMMENTSPKIKSTDAAFPFLLLISFSS